MIPKRSVIESYLQKKEEAKDFVDTSKFTKEVKDVIRYVITRQDYYMIGKFAGYKKPKTVEAVMMGLRSNDKVLSVAYDVSMFRLREMLKVLSMVI
jgi:hypothetical protein